MSYALAKKYPDQAGGLAGLLETIMDLGTNWYIVAFIIALGGSVYYFANTVTETQAVSFLIQNAHKEYLGNAYTSKIASNLISNKDTGNLVTSADGTTIYNTEGNAYVFTSYSTYFGMTSPGLPTTKCQGLVRAAKSTNWKSVSVSGSTAYTPSQINGDTPTTLCAADSNDVTILAP